MPIYLDGNSLGRLPKAALDTADRVVRHEWGDRLIRSWDEAWMGLASRIGDKIGRLVGARPGEVLVADSTSVNLFKLASGALAAREGRPRIISDDLNFPSDLHVLAGLAATHGRALDIVPSPDGIHGPVEEILASLDADVALVSLSGTAYRSGYTYDVERVTRAAHAVGALILWDFSHTAGSVPIDVEGAGVDLAVGCSYKYLNGGPGAPAWLYVRAELAQDLHNPISGWMGHADTFSFDPRFRAAPGTRRFLTGTPPVLSLAMIEPGVDLLLEAGMDTVRSVSLDMTAFAIDLVDRHLARRGFELRSPRDGHRGSHVTIGHPDALAIDLALIAEQHVIPDFRPPDAIRLGITPLSVGYEQVEEAIGRICTVVDNGDHERFRDVEVGVT